MGMGMLRGIKVCKEWEGMGSGRGGERLQDGVKKARRNEERLKKRKTINVNTNTKIK